MIAIEELVYQLILLALICLLYAFVEWVDLLLVPVSTSPSINWGLNVG